MATMSEQAVNTTVRQPTEQETMINRMYDAQQRANEANLKSVATGLPEA